MLPRRLRQLPRQTIASGLTILEARGLRARLLGLAFLGDLPEGHALLIPRCRSVHTFGMRFVLDITFLDARGQPLRTERNVPPRRVITERRARAVLERRSVSMFAPADRPCVEREGVAAATGRPRPRGVAASP